MDPWMLQVQAAEEIFFEVDRRGGGEYRIGVLVVLGNEDATLFGMLKRRHATQASQTSQAGHPFGRQGFQYCIGYGLGVDEVIGCPLLLVS